MILTNTGMDPRRDPRSLSDPHARNLITLDIPQFLSTVLGERLSPGTAVGSVGLYFRVLYLILVPPYGHNCSNLNVGSNGLSSPGPKRTSLNV